MAVIAASAPQGSGRQEGRTLRAANRLKLWKKVAEAGWCYGHRHLNG
jgi:hypothetical protein